MAQISKRWKLMLMFIVLLNFYCSEISQHKQGRNPIKALVISIDIVLLIKLPPTSWHTVSWGLLKNGHIHLYTFIQRNLDPWMCTCINTASSAAHTHCRLWVQMQQGVLADIERVEEMQRAKTSWHCQFIPETPEAHRVLFTTSASPSAYSLLTLTLL